MVARRPLALVDGRPSTLPDADSIAGVFSGMMSMFRPAAGVFIAPVCNGGALGTAAQGANRNIIAPFVAAFDVAINQVAISVSTLVAGSFSKVVIYGSDANGRPSNLIAESANIDCGTGPVNTYTTPLSVTFRAGQLYWIGVRSSSTQTLRTFTQASLPPLSYTIAATPGVQPTLIKTETYANPAGAWGYASAQHSNIQVPAVWMRVA